MPFEITQGVVAAFLQTYLRAGVAVPHLAPVQHFIPLRNNDQIVLRGSQGADIESSQLIDKSGLKEKMRIRVVPSGLLPDRFCQISRWIDCGIE